MMADDLEAFVRNHAAAIAGRADDAQPAAAAAAATSTASPSDLDAFVNSHPANVKAILDAADHPKTQVPAVPIPDSYPGDTDFVRGVRRGGGPLAVGIYKGAASTGTGIINILGHPENFLPGGPLLMKRFMPPNVLDDESFKAEIQRGLETHGFGEGLGKFAEQVGEFFVPGAAVERSIQATKGLPLATRIGSAMWREALANAGTTYLQTGGDAKAAATSGIVGGALRGGLSLPGFLRDGKLVQEVLAEAEHYGIPLTKAEQTQGSIRRFVESMVRRSVGGFRRFAKFDVERNSLLRDIADSIAKSADSAPMDSRSMGEYIQGSLQQVRRAAGEELGATTGEILKSAGDLPLDLGKIDRATGKYKPSGLVKAARDIVADRKMREISQFMEGAHGNVDDVNRAYSILDKFANPVEHKALDPLEQAIANNTGNVPISNSDVKPLSLSTAKELRTLLFDIAHSDQSTIGKGSIKRLNAALHDEMMSTLKRSNMPEAAEAFQNASSKYKQTMDLLETDVLQRIAKRGSPETIASVLRGAESESAAIALTKALKPEQMERVRAAMMQNLLDGSMHPNGLFMTEQFKRAMDDLGPQAQRALFGAELSTELAGFAKAAARYKLVPSTKELAEGLRLPFMAQLRLSGYASAGSAAGVGSALMSDPTKALFALGGTAGLMAAETGGSALLARMMTKPSVVRDFTRALSVDPMSSVGRQVAARVSAYFAREIARNNATITSTITKSDQRGLSNADFVKAHPELYPPELRPPASGSNNGSSSSVPEVPSAKDDEDSNPNSTFQRGRVGSEWPRNPNDNDENDALLNAGNPARLLPDHFAGAKKVVWGSPIKQMPGYSDARGLYGYEFDPDKRKAQQGSANSILIARSAVDQPGTEVHELGHAIWVQDLSEQRKAQFKQIFDTTINKFRAEAQLKRAKGDELKSIARKYPQGIILNFVAHRDDPERAYNEAFAEMNSHYMANPTAFKRAYPQVYAFYKQIYGREYIQKSVK
jgi:hypothetical protein